MVKQRGVVTIEPKPKEEVKKKKNQAKKKSKKIKKPVPPPTLALTWDDKWGVNYEAYSSVDAMKEWIKNLTRLARKRTQRNAAGIRIQEMDLTWSDGSITTLCMTEEERDYFNVKLDVILKKERGGNKIDIVGPCGRADCPNCGNQ